MRFAGKVALVTGAGSGIGAATALGLAAEGALVGVLDNRPERVATVCRQIEAARGRAIGLVAEVADEAAMRATMSALTDAGGRLDLIVANAGINGVWAPIDDITPAEWDHTIAVNLRGTYLTLHLGVPHLKAAGGGSIVVVSSINGTRTFSTPGATAYSAAKAGLAAMSNQLALELGRYRIRVNTICPGSTVTNMGQNTTRRNAAAPLVFPDGDIPLTGGAPASADDIAAAILLLLSDDARHITGARLMADGGQSLLR